LITQHASWQALQSHAEKLKPLHLNELFNLEQDRFNAFSFRHEDLLVDFSKQRINLETLELLKKLSESCQLADWKDRLFSAENVNTSEKRPALHFALRNPVEQPLDFDGHDIVKDVHQNLDKMAKFVNRIHSGQWRGYSGRAINTIVNIGVGGSDLGPYMTSKALSDSHVPAGKNLNIHFVSSMDGSQLADLLENLNPQRTLFIISSKSFTTIDTLSNANTARQWIKSASGADDLTLNRRHFIGVSANPEKMSEWGIPANSQLFLWDWIGGRYSMWSAIGLPIALKVGMNGFREMLSGAHSMDNHFKTAEFESNLPTLLGLISIWNINFLNIHAHAMLPYDGRLSLLPAYLEQLEMESNGKNVDRQDDTVNYHTCPVIWGEVGPNAQHAFYQLLHQGTEPVMCDFIVAARRYHDSNNTNLQHQHLLALANCFAQSQVLAIGDLASTNDKSTPVYKRYQGNQPSTTIVMDELSPYSLGQLISLYEHKVFVQSVIWNVNPFDQWGVELGKTMATDLLDPLTGSKDCSSLNSSTAGLIRLITERQVKSK